MYEFVVKKIFYRTELKVKSGEIELCVIGSIHADFNLKILD